MSCLAACRVEHHWFSSTLHFDHLPNSPGLLIPGIVMRAFLFLRCLQVVELHTLRGRFIIDSRSVHSWEKAKKLHP